MEVESLFNMRFVLGCYQKVFRLYIFFKGDEVRSGTKANTRHVL